MAVTDWSPWGDIDTQDLTGPAPGAVTGWSAWAELETVGPDVAEVTAWSPWTSRRTRGTMLRKRGASTSRRALIRMRTPTGTLPPTDVGPGPAQQLTVSPPTLLAPGTTSQQITFTVDPVMAVTRTTQVAVQGSSDYSPAQPREVVNSTGSHTATFGGSADGGDLLPGTAYRGKVTLSGPGIDTVVFYVDFTTAPLVTSMLVWDRTMYPPEFRAALAGDYSQGVQKCTWVPTGSTYTTSDPTELVLRGPTPSWQSTNGRKLLIDAPEVFVDPASAPKLENASYVLRRLRVQWTQWFVSATKPLTNPDGSTRAMVVGRNTSSSEPGIRNQFFVHKGNGGGEASAPDGTFHALESCAVLPAPDGKIYCHEFGNYDGKDDQLDTLVIQNCRAANADRTQGLSHVIWGGSGDHYGGDLWQFINGPSYLYVLGFVGVTTYQGFFDQSQVFGTADGILKRYERVEIKGDRGDATATPPRVGGNAYLWWDTTRGDLDITRQIGTGADGVYLDPVPGKTREETIYRAQDFNHDDPVVIGPAPRDFVPLASFLPTYDAAVLADSPVGYWPGTGGGDFAGTRHATVHGAPGVATMPNGDRVPDFDGVDDYLEVADSPRWSVPTTGRLTIEAWLRPDVLEFPNDEATGYVHWAGKGTTSGASGNREWACRIYSLTNTESRPNRISGYAFNPSGALGTGAFWQDPVTAGQWLHYTLVINTADKGGAYPNGYVLVRKNGVDRQKVDLNDTAVVIPADVSAPMRWGSRDFQSFFAGAIGKFAVYDYELPASRSLAHYRLGALV